MHVCIKHSPTPHSTTPRSPTPRSATPSQTAEIKFAGGCRQPGFLGNSMPGTPGREVFNSSTTLYVCSWNPILSFCVYSNLTFTYFYVLLRTVNHTFTYFYALLRNFMYFCVLVCTQKSGTSFLPEKKPLRECRKPQKNTCKNPELQVFASYPSVWTIFYTKFD